MPDSMISALVAGAPAVATDLAVVSRSGDNRSLLLSDLEELFAGRAHAVRRNAVIGGSAGTNPWQLGTSFASPASGTYTADQWLMNNTSAGTVTISKSADAPTVAQAGKLLTHCFLLDVTTGDSSIAAGDLMSFQTRIEGFVWRNYAQRACTLRFWHKHTKTGVHCVALRNGGTDRSLVLQYNQIVSDAWEEAIVDIPASPSAGTWNYETGIGVFIDFALAGGSTYQTTAGAWQTGNFFVSGNQVNDLDALANNFRIEDVRLVVGDATNEWEIESRSFAEELALCQRYLPAWNSTSTTDAIAPGSITATTTCQAMIALPRPARVKPTGVGFAAAGDFTVNAAGAAFAASAVALGGPQSTTLATVNLTIAGATAGQAALVRFNAATGRLYFTGCQL